MKGVYISKLYYYYIKVKKNNFHKKIVNLYLLNTPKLLKRHISMVYDSVKIYLIIIFLDLHIISIKI